jgi:hypothetical protein
VGPKGSMKSLSSAFADQMDPVYFPLTMDQMPVELEFREMAAGETFEAAGVKVTTHTMHHPIATFGYRLEEDGRTFVYATDQEPWTDPDILSDTVARYKTESRPAAEIDSLWPKEYIEWCRGADLLVHDAQYSAEEYRTRVGCSSHGNRPRASSRSFIMNRCTPTTRSRRWSRRRWARTPTARTAA